MKYQFARRTQTASRQGVILLVVIALLTLFAIVGLAFVYYAQSKADAARVYREAQVKSATQTADVNPDLLLSEFLRQAIYDLRDDYGGVNSVLRGHSLARSEYGYNADPNAVNNQPFSGSGRLHLPAGYPNDPSAFPTSQTASAKSDDYYLVNYQWNTTDGFVRDPERYGTRADPGKPLSPYAGGFNPSYTYPDLNNMILGAIKSDGTLLMPSYHRPWLFGDNNPANPNWTNAQGRYLTLRPRPADMGPGFPLPAATGDVQNLLTSGGPDSYWIDLGDQFLLTMPDGTRFKPMYAAFITDLDNRMNVNVTGNIRGPGNTHVSNQGWGPWEANLSYVLNTVSSQNESAALFLGNGAGQYGRYGQNTTPDLPANYPAMPQPESTPHFYGQVDYDGCNEMSGNAATGPLALSATPYSFPTYPPGYGNRSAAETTTHPSLYDVFQLFQPGGDDQSFDIANMKYLLRNGTIPAERANSSLAKLCPNTFANNRIQSLFTTISFDVDRPGMTPWVWDPTQQQYTLAAPSPYPTGAAIPFPTPGATPGTAPQANSEFGGDWRVNTTAPFDVYKMRLDLSPSLPDYPQPGADGVIPAASMAQFNTAQQARQQLAQNLFTRLRLVTGSPDPTTVAPGPQYDALRWLAQLAVNMVDFIDGDDYMTPFTWNASNPADTVFGTELPKLVLNEAYIEYVNDPTDPGLSAKPTPKAQKFNVNCWVELHNPLSQDPNHPPDNGSAPLQITPGAGAPYSVYEVQVTKPNTNLKPPGPNAFGNVIGDPDNPTPVPGGSIYTTVNNFTSTAAAPPASVTSVVLPAGGAASGPDGQNQGYYVLGPTGVPFPGGNVTSTCQRPEMTFSDQAANLQPNPYVPSILLRRLACPNLAPQPNPAAPGYNPYVTVDYMQSVTVNNAAATGINGPNAPPTAAVNTRLSYGRNQPYAADASQQAAQAPAPALPTEPQHTFFKQNVPSQATFDWLTHLDRQLVSPMELLQVSAFKPHELTQQFATAAGPANFGHLGPWFDQTSRIYRLLELLETHNRAAGVGVGGRVPGLININTIWDGETFMGLCDPQTSNVFTGAQIFNSGTPLDPTTLWYKMLKSRSPGLTTGGTLALADQPFWGLGNAFSTGDQQYPNGSGLNNTILRDDGSGGPTPPRLFQVPGQAHPYLQDQLLNKIFNQTTTRSNVYAVWLTVGFFQVVQEKDNAGNPIHPVKLGAEINPTNRHHMFAIVDRSALTLPPAMGTLTSQTPVSAIGVQTVTPAAGSTGSNAGNYPPQLMDNTVNPPRPIQAGTVLSVDSGPNQETVTVTGIDTTAKTFTARFNKLHSVNPPFLIQVPDPGNPGPQPQFQPRDNSAVVPYYTIID